MGKLKAGCTTVQWSMLNERRCDDGDGNATWCFNDTKIGVEFVFIIIIIQSQNNTNNNRISLYHLPILVEFVRSRLLLFLIGVKYSASFIPKPVLVGQ